MVRLRIWVKNLETKQVIRTCIYEIREHLTPSQWETMTSRIERNVFFHPAYRQAEDILCYLDIRREVGTRGIIEKAWKDGKRTWIPKVMGKEMEFFRLTAWEDLSPGAFGIPEPKDGERFQEKQGLVVLPGTAYDASGYRIGYGGGYYDRYLAKHPELTKMGIGFSFQLFQTLPKEPCDIPVDIVITEEGVNQMEIKLPKDPMLLLSVVNTKIRDYYHTLDALCEDMCVEKEAIISQLKGIDYEYDESRHQFV